jgi:hypothetical protein
LRERIDMDHALRETDPARHAMIRVFEISPANEGPVAKRLAEMVRRAWPDLASSATEHVTILVGIRTLREVDLVVFVELDAPRDVPRIKRRDGSLSPECAVHGAVMIVEVKQLEQARFTVQGTQIFPNYHAEHARSVNAQVDDCVIAFRNYKDRYALADFHVNGVGWLTEVSPDLLDGVSPWIVGSDAGWFSMLDAAAQHSPQLYGVKPRAVMHAIATIRETLERKRVLTPRDRRRSEALCRDLLAAEVVDHLAARVGTMQIRITGRGGSGKTTTLALLAKRLATIDGDRVLILTFYKTLCGDIAHLVDTLIDIPGVRARIRVETVITFAVNALAALDVSLPRTDGGLDYAALPQALREARCRLIADPEVVALLREAEPKRFDYDYVFIDEAQDWSDDERDFIRTFYGVQNLVLADGLEQLVRRQTACDWTAGIPKAARHGLHLGRSLRMASNLATFANTFARMAGLDGWEIKPVDELPGGRVIVIDGTIENTAAFFEALRMQLASAGAAPVDALICVPPPMVRVAESGRRESTCAVALRAAGMKVWDACDVRVREEPPSDADAWRIVQYDSCRGLEGWITVAYGLDQLVAAKQKHPNFNAGETDTPENVARRWLMIALTRAVHTLIVTIANPNAPVAQTLRDVTAATPKDVVEWMTPDDCITRLTPSAAPVALP